MGMKGGNMMLEVWKERHGMARNLDSVGLQTLVMTNSRLQPWEWVVGGSMKDQLFGGEGQDIKDQSVGRTSVFTQIEL